MIDGKGRTIDYLRLSVTDRCNLRCLYCMPECGVEPLRHGQIMRFEEMLRLCSIMAGLGVTKFKISGGEPLVRRGVADFIHDLKRLPGVEQVTLTTNGLLLAEYLPQLRSAPIDGINISLDTLKPQTYSRLTRRGCLEQVLAGLEAALASGLRPLKLNTVLLRGVNDNEIESLAAISQKNPVSLRFIELMPIGLGVDYQPVPGQEVLQRLTAAFGPPETCRVRLGNGPASYYSFPGFQAQIGLIDAVSHGFCSCCNRVRMTADGWLKLCLQYDVGVDLLSPLRAGAGERELRELVLEAVRHKPEKHSFGASGIDHRESKNMNAIGG